MNHRSPAERGREGNTMRRFSLPGFLFITLVILLSGPILSAQDGDRKAERKKPGPVQEEVEDYFRKWLKQDAFYLISDAEKAVFEKLSTVEEKEQFIEQFWFRRDPDPRTAENEFKEEHYRRIAYSNEKFTSGDLGWRTDRGRIYIIHGPSASVVARPDGGAYVRKIEEGGGVTSVHPFEVWRYHYIEGIGNDIELEFIDPTQTGEYKLAVFDWEKDALTMIPGAGATLAEQIGMSTRADRPGLIPASGGAQYGPQNMFRSRTDTPFRRYEINARVQSVPDNAYADLRELIEVNIAYDALDFEVDQNHFRLNEEIMLVPVTIRVKNRDLTFKREADHQIATLSGYGLVSSMTNRFMTEFEEEITTSFSQAEFEQGLLKSSVFQKVISIDRKSRYKIDLIVKDMNSTQVGITRRALNVPAFRTQKLQSSSLLISDQMEALNSVPDREEMFVIGDVRILPNPDLEFSSKMPLGLYFHVYNAAIDQSTLQPSVSVTYRLFKDGQLLRMLTDQQGESTQFFSPQRLVLLRKLTLQGLDPGGYRIGIEVVDRISEQSLELAQDFRLVGEAGQKSSE